MKRILYFIPRRDQMRLIWCLTRDLTMFIAIVMFYYYSIILTH